jgi:hypothetical protein
VEWYDARQYLKVIFSKEIRH